MNNDSGIIKVDPLSLILFVPAIILLFWGMYSHFDYKSLMNNCTESIEGTVFKIDEHVNRRGRGTSRSYTIYAEFELDGRTYQCFGESRRKLFKVDDTVNMRYNPNDPEECYIIRAKPQDNVIVMLFGALLAALGIAANVNYYRTGDTTIEYLKDAFSKYQQSR